MPRVYLSFDDLGLGIQFVDALESAGHTVAWPRTSAGAPPDDLEVPPDAVILGATTSDVLLGKWAHAWRQLDPPPAVLALCPNNDAAHVARSAGALPLPTSAERDQLNALIPRAISLRYTAELSLRFARDAAGVPDAGEPLAQAVQIVAAARRMDPGLIREALRPRIHEYVTATEMIDDLRGQRSLEIPEIPLVTKLDGTATVGRVIDTAPIPAASAARLVWALACVGGVRLTAEPPDQRTDARRAVTRARQHLRERSRRLRRGRADYFEVLEVRWDPTPDELQTAVHRLAARFSPSSLAHLDLGELAPLVDPLWQQIQKAYRMLAAPQARKRYEEWLVQKGADVARMRRDRTADPAAAESDFLAGQDALSGGEVFKAVSLFASAARRFPNHADYEAYLAWARYRAALEKGEDKAEVALRERSLIEAEQTGRAPRPRALLALGMLCAACEDPLAARWYLREALSVDPDFGPARQILARLGG